MREKDLPIDRTKHVCYTKNAQKCVQKLLHRYYDEQTAAQLWEKVQLQYCEYLKDEQALAVCEGLFSRLSWLVPVSEAMMLPVSAFRLGFTNGLMSESMVLWFGFMLIWESKQTKGESDREVETEWK